MQEIINKIIETDGSNKLHDHKDEQYHIVLVSMCVLDLSSFFSKILEDKRIFFVGHWYPFWTSGALGFKARVDSLLACFTECPDPQIQNWYHTCANPLKA